MNDEMSGDTTGGCQCGGVRFALSAPFQQIYVCHCAECRRQSGSAFGISAIAPAAALTITQGAVKTWRRDTDSGGALDCCFCPDCGARLWHRRSASPDRVSIKGGALDTPLDLSRAHHIWTARRLPGVVIPDTSETSEGEPE